MVAAFVCTCMCVCEREAVRIAASVAVALFIQRVSGLQHVPGPEESVE